MEHLGDEVRSEVLDDPVSAFDAFRDSAARLDAWHDGGGRGPRPAGQLRAYTQPRLSWWTRGWSAPMYRLLYDPDGRPLRLRRRHEF
jgi:hypothetical protein